MKRNYIAVLLLCFVIVISACGQTTSSDSQGATAASTQPMENTDWADTAQPVENTDGTDTVQPVESLEENSYVDNKEMTIEFSFGTKTGNYTGPLNKDGLPEGTGTFTSKNSDGDTWVYTGDFVNGHFDGEGEASWPSANYKEIGHYVNDVIQPIDSAQVSMVYQNPDEYIFQCIEVSGKVYNIIDKNTFQMYEDLESSYLGNNTVVYHDSTDYVVEVGDYIRMKAIVCGELQYQNVIGGNMTALQLRAKEIQETSFVEAAYPTIRSVDVHESQTQNGYSIIIEKIEFAEKETRVYFSVENGGKSKISLYSWDIEAEQSNRQYEAQSHIGMDYPQLPDGIRVGNIAEGIISFPPLAQSDFKVYIKISTEDWTEQLDEMELSVSIPPVD